MFDEFIELPDNSGYNKKEPVKQSEKRFGDGKNNYAGESISTNE